MFVFLNKLLSFLLESEDDLFIWLRDFSHLDFKLSYCHFLFFVLVKHKNILARGVVLVPLVKNCHFLFMNVNKLFYFLLMSFFSNV